ncbi:MAG: glycerol-3-phosphate acyltransferase [Clostridia bacterium]|nr:glycerol-3-phosphate acyltransferase [Clostridia bacterium]
MIWLRYIIVIIVSYFLGTIAVGKIVAEKMGHIDISKVGSGNAGTTNVLRTLGWLPSILTLVGDILKAVISALLGKLIAGETGMLIAGVSVVVGHVWPVMRDFKGGKGIAAAFGFIIFTDPLTALLLFIEQISIIAFTRYMSLGSIVSCIMYPVFTIIFNWGHPVRIVVALLIGAIALYAHRPNIVRLINKNENRLDFKKINEISKKKK